MTYREACARIGVLPGASQEQALKAADRRLAVSTAAWWLAKSKLTTAEDDLIEAKEIKRKIEKGEDK